MDLTTLLERIAYRRTEGGEGSMTQEILDVITAPQADARGTLYVCVNTPLSRGRTGMEAAYACGCRAFLCDHDAFPGPDATVLVCPDPEQVLGEIAARVHGYPAHHLTVLGVSGTAGKSSVCHMLRRLLVQTGKRVGTITSDGVWCDGAHAPCTPIVPNAADLQRTLAKMLANGIEIALLELSSYQLLHHAAAGMDLLAVAITNFAPRHIGNGEHVSLSEYRAAKQHLLDCGAPFSVLPVDAPFRGCGRVLTFGECGQFFARDVEHDVDAAQGFVTRFLLCEQEKSVPVMLPLLGEIHLENALICAALARAVGLTLPQIAEGLSGVRVPGRMECVLFDRGRAVYLDSAFSPEDLQVALKALGSRCEGRLCVLLGSVGGRARHRRAPLGQVTSAYADFVYLTADDPDTEDPTSICREMQAGMQEPARSVIIADRQEAILRAVREMRPGDVLLIAGKGELGDQLIAGKRELFCEREIVAKAAKDP